MVSKVVLPVMNPMAPALPKTARTYSQVDENYPASRPAVKGEHAWNHEVGDIKLHHWKQFFYKLM